MANPFVLAVMKAFRGKLPRPPDKPADPTADKPPPEPPPPPRS